MRLGCIAGVALIAAAGMGVPLDIYQWTYDQLPLGLGWTGHLFANRTGLEVLGLALLPSAPGPAQVLAVGGMLVPTLGSPEGLVFTGRVVPGGVVTVALPQGVGLGEAAWITAAGRVPIDLDPPLPRVYLEEIRPTVVVLSSGGKDDSWLTKKPPSEGGDPGGAETLTDPGDASTTKPALPGDSEADRGSTKEPGGGSGSSEMDLGDEVLLVWPSDLDPEVLRVWEGFPYLVRLDGRRSFSPVGETIVAWRWTWEDGLIQEGPVVVRGFSFPGIYWVWLTVTDSAGRAQTLRWPVKAETDLSAWIAALTALELWRSRYESGRGEETIETKPLEAYPFDHQDLKEAEEKEAKVRIQ